MAGTNTTNTMPQSEPASSLYYQNQSEESGSGQTRSSQTNGFAACKALCTAVSDINPYSAPRRSTGEYWEQARKQLEQEGYYLGWDVERLKRRLVDLVKFKENPTWKRIGGERQIADNKFQLNESELIRLAAPLEKVMGLKEDARKDKEDKTASKRKAEEEERGRGLALRFSAMQGMIPTEQLSLNNTENASLVADPRQKRKRRCRVPAHIACSPIGGILEDSNVTKDPTVTIETSSDLPSTSTTTPMLWMPPVSPIRQVYHQSTPSSSSDPNTHHTLPVAKLSSMFLELTKAQESKREKETEEIKEEIKEIRHELRQINSTLGNLCTIMEDIRTRTEVYRQRGN